MGIKTPWNLTHKSWLCFPGCPSIYSEVTSQYRIQNGFGCIYQLLSNSKDSMFFSQSGDIMGGQTLVSLGSKYAYKKVFVMWRKTEPSLSKTRLQHLATKYMRQNNIFILCRWKVSLSELFSSKKWWVSSHELFYHRKNFLFARFIPFTFSPVTDPNKPLVLQKLF